MFQAWISFYISHCGVIGLLIAVKITSMVLTINVCGKCMKANFQLSSSGWHMLIVDSVVKRVQMYLSTYADVLIMVTENTCTCIYTPVFTLWKDRSTIYAVKTFE